jgi:hypothetical protein
MKRVRAVKVTGKTQSLEELMAAGVVIVGGPETVRGPDDRGALSGTKRASRTRLHRDRHRHAG